MEIIMNIKDFANNVSEQMLKGVKALEPDTYDEDKFPYGVAPGASKFGNMVCPTCGKPPSDTPHHNNPKAFLFRNEGSAKEYRISGMCQACQDSVFGED
jgi:hypothetical protein